MKSSIVWSVGVLAGFSVAVVAHAQVDEHGPPKIIHRVNPREIGRSAPTGSTASTSPILKHGGPVLSTPTIYTIWYGAWNQSNNSDTAAGQQIVRDFERGIGGSPYFLINRSYDGVSGAVNVGAEATDTYSQGNHLKDKD